MSESAKRLSEDKLANKGKDGIEEKKGKLDQNFLEEDDEFEEFPAEEFNEVDGMDEEKEEANMWEDNWDDELRHDDFAKQLQEELKKQAVTK